MRVPGLTPRSAWLVGCLIACRAHPTTTAEPCKPPAPEVRPVGTVEILDRGERPWVTASAHGRWFAIGTALVETRTGRVIETRNDHAGANAGTCAFTVVFSPDERYAIYGDGGPTTIIRDLDTDTELGHLEGMPSIGGAGQRGVAFDPTSHHAFVRSDAHGHELRSYINLATHEIASDDDGAPTVEEMVFDPNGRFAAWIGDAGPVVRDLTTRTFLAMPEADVTGLEIGGDLLAYTTTTGDMIVVRLPAATPVLHLTDVRTWQLDPEGHRLAWSASADRVQVVHVRDLARGRDARTIGLAGAQQASFRCAAGGWDWRALTRSTLTGKRDCDALVQQLTVDLATGRATVDSSSPGTEIEDATALGDLCAHAGANCSAATRGSEWRPPIWNDMTVLPYDDGLATVQTTTAARRTLLAESRYATADDWWSMFSPPLVAGDYFAGYDSSGVMRLWNLATGAVVWRSPRRAEPFAAAEFSVTGDELVTASPSGTVRHWNVATGELLRTWRPPGCDVVALAVTGQGEAVVACTHADHVAVYREGVTAPLYTGATATLALEASGQALAMHVRQADDSDAIVVLPLVAGGPSRTFAAQPSRSFAMSFVGDHLAVADQGAVWNVVTGAVQPVPLGSGAPALSRDATRVAVHARDGVHVLPLAGSRAAIDLPAPAVGELSPAAFARVDRMWWAGSAMIVAAGGSEHDGFARVAMPFGAPAHASSFTGTTLAVSPAGLVAVATTRGLELQGVTDLTVVRAFAAIPDAAEAISVAPGVPPRITGTGAAAELAACVLGTTQAPLASCRYVSGP